MIHDHSGNLFQSSEDELFIYLQGQGNLIEELQTTLDGLLPGQSCTIEVSPDDRYGHRGEEAAIDLPRETLAETIEVETGTMVAANGLMELTRRNQTQTSHPTTPCKASDYPLRVLRTNG